MYFKKNLLVKVVILSGYLGVMIDQSLVAATSSNPVSNNKVVATVEPKQSSSDYSDFGGANTKDDSHEMWLALREQYFTDRPILENEKKYSPSAKSTC